MDYTRDSSTWTRRGAPGGRARQRAGSRGGPARRGVQEACALLRAPQGRRPRASCRSASTSYTTREAENISQRRNDIMKNQYCYPSLQRLAYSQSGLDPHSLHCKGLAPMDRSSEGRARYAEARRRRECARARARDSPATGVPGARGASCIPRAGVSVQAEKYRFASITSGRPHWALGFAMATATQSSRCCCSPTSSPRTSPAADDSSPCTP